MGLLYSELEEEQWATSRTCTTKTYLLYMRACQVVAVHADLLERDAIPERLEPTWLGLGLRLGLGLGSGLGLERLEPTRQLVVRGVEDPQRGQLQLRDRALRKGCGEGVGKGCGCGEGVAWGVGRGVA